MDWLFEHFQILLVIGLAFAAWLKNRAESKGEEEAERQAREEMVRQLQQLDKRPARKTPPPTPTQWDTRPLSPGSPQTTPPPLKDIFEQASQGEAVPQTRQKAKKHSDAYDSAPAPWQEFKHVDTSHSEIGALENKDQQILQRQLEMQERLTELKRNAEEFKQQTGGARATQRRLENRGKSAESKQPIPQKLTSALKDVRQTRRAIVLREILGPPLGLR